MRFLLVLVLACAAPLARAQTPSCAWGSGVTLPGGDSRALLITDDGGSGVIAIAWPVISSPVSYTHLTLPTILRV